MERGGRLVRHSLWGGPAAAPCLTTTFESRATATPGRLAVVDGDDRVSYADLLAWVRGMASMLHDEGVRPGDTVAVAGPRSAPMVAATLAVLWAGATFLPLDSEYPARRLEHMLSDARPRLLLRAGPAGSELGFAAGVTVREVPDRSAVNGSMAAVPCTPHLPGYIIYTSGSTGWPKGVGVPHLSLDNMVQWQWNHSVRRDLTTAQFAPLNFDVSFQEVLGTLCGGGTLAIMPEELRKDPFELLDWLEAQGVERIFLPVVALQMLAIASQDDDCLSRTKLAEFNVAGEQLVCTPAVRAMFAAMPGCRLNNHYGQSESAMVTVYTMPGPPAGWPALAPIGTPLPACEVLVDPVDDADPEVGELLVTGAPLSDGYLHQPTLTARRYVAIEPTPHGHGRAFRTGDLVRIRDGQIYFISRVDRDIKVRGYRVNLQEVEAQLLQLQGVTAAVCVAAEITEGNRSLHAVVTTDDTAPFSADAMREALGSVLPEPFIPSTIDRAESFPRTPSGKIDRDRLVGEVTAKVRS